jgi:hypothetical protein
MSTNVLITNSNEGEIDGIYTYRANYGNKSLFVKEGYSLVDIYNQITPGERGMLVPPPGGVFPYAIYWRDLYSRWEITVDSDNLQSLDGLLYTSTNNTEHPWEATNWERVFPLITPRDPTLTPQYPIVSEFGFSAETTTMLRSKFGTVANFLRLRNLGQI